MPGTCLAETPEFGGVVRGRDSPLRAVRNSLEDDCQPDRREWLTAAPGRRELAGSRALVIGYGAIGKLVVQRLKGFDVDVSIVRRTPSGEDGFLGPDQWRARLGEFDWIILSAPATADTIKMIRTRKPRAK